MGTIVNKLKLSKEKKDPLKTLREFNKIMELIKKYPIKITSPPLPQNPYVPLPDNVFPYDKSRKRN